MLLRGVLGAVLCAALAFGATHHNPYCEITEEHTLCQYEGIGPACKHLRAREVPHEDIKLILRVHNYLRVKVANGWEHRGEGNQAQPNAANMLELEWDKELANVAQRLADQCVNKHDCDKCRALDRFDVGQNMAIKHNADNGTKAAWGVTMMQWYDEVKTFDPAHIDSFKFSHEYGHYTQMMWATTTLVGCGYSMYFSGGLWNKLYVCNYGPPGNAVYHKMYQKGTPCSHCPTGTTCSKKYPGLCAASAKSGLMQAPPTHATRSQIVGPQGHPSSGSSIQDLVNQLYGGGSPAGYGGQHARPSSGSSIQDMINRLYGGGSHAGYGGQRARPSSGSSIQDLINQMYGGGGSHAGYGGQGGRHSSGSSIQDLINQIYGGGGSHAGYGGQGGRHSSGSSIQDLINQIYGGGSPTGHGGLGGSPAGHGGLGGSPAGHGGHDGSPAGHGGHDGSPAVHGGHDGSPAGHGGQGGVPSSDSNDESFQDIIDQLNSGDPAGENSFQSIQGWIHGLLEGIGKPEEGAPAASEGHEPHQSQAPSADAGSQAKAPVKP